MASEAQLNALAKSGVTLLRLSSRQWQSISETRQHGTRFSLKYPHEVAMEARRKSFVLISVSGDEPSSHVAFVTSVQATATFDTRVAFDACQPIQPSSINELLNTIQEPALRNGARNLTHSDANAARHSRDLSGRWRRWHPGWLGRRHNGWEPTVCSEGFRPLYYLRRFDKFQNCCC
jgi:hypothetical protein